MVSTIINKQASINCNFIQINSTFFFIKFNSNSNKLLITRSKMYFK